MSFMHIPYEQKLQHPADFRVAYRFYTPEEGGRTQPPHQGYRSDFWYEHPEHQPNSIFMIWPEFEDNEGNVILDERPVPKSGTARMWILVPERRPYHGKHVQVGTVGYMMEGSRRVTECKVVEIIGLLDNSITQKR